MGVFGAFNYGLHLFGGYLGGRFLSNRKLFVGGMALQVIGCACIATGTLALFYVGLALFLTGSGLNVTCINMMLTQRFTPDDPRREGAFLWNYAGMNVGFFVGFSAAGYFQATQSYSSLFIFATLGNFVAIILAVSRGRRWPTATHRCSTRRRSSSSCASSPVSAFSSASFPSCGSCCSGPAAPKRILKMICAAVALTLIYLTVRHQDRRERRNMTAYLILTIGSLMFWSLYQMAPSGLMLFAVHNVNLMVGRSRFSRSGSKTSTPSDRARRAVVGGALHPDARARLENRHPEAVRGVAPPDGARLFHSPASASNWPAPMARARSSGCS